MTTGQTTAAPSTFVSTNPATGEVTEAFAVHDAAATDQRLDLSSRAAGHLRRLTLEERAEALRRLADYLDQRVGPYAALIAREMGKPVTEAQQEIAKCASTCRIVAEQGPAWLRPVQVRTEASSSGIRFDSLGPVLAVMPWNYPFYQAIRFIAPAIMAGNPVVLKHAENVPACAEELERAVAEACGSDGLVVNLRVPREKVTVLIADPRVKAVTLTGSVGAGRAVAAAAGQVGKKVVLELGGSDPFIVLDDADLDEVIPAAIAGRFANAGQSCISAKRIIVPRSLREPFLDRLAVAVARLMVGDPCSPATDMGPLARADLRTALDRQVQATVAAGATTVLAGGPEPGPGYFYRPVILTDIPAGSPAAAEELFGPVASVFPVESDEEAIALANATQFGLGCSVWTRETERADRYIEQVESGMVFVNSIVKSDGHIPFGGIKDSGIGREIGILGVREFTNAKTTWIA
jgi:acyl-CoA reductase-like NAD-dependent aldehyde dehydrogenase